MLGDTLINKTIQHAKLSDSAKIDSIVYATVFEFQGVKEKNKSIDSITYGMHGISILIDQKPTVGFPYYSVTVGRTYVDHFETYYHLVVDAKNWVISYNDYLTYKP